MYNGKVCKTKNCGKEAQLRCPTCVKLGLIDAFFCSQVHQYKKFFLIIFGLLTIYYKLQ